jgi:hypothetical protein
MADNNNPVSWDLFYLTKEGMEAHLQLKGATVEDVLEKAKDALNAVCSAGGKPRPSESCPTTPEEPSSNAPPNCPECHQTMVYREGTSKAGKPYKGYFCPDRDCKGEPVWVND